MMRIGILFFVIKGETMKAKPLLNLEGDHIGSQWRCHCGRLVESYSGYDVDCDCGQMFNGFGQQLRPQSQWGEGGDD